MMVKFINSTSDFLSLKAMYFNRFSEDKFSTNAFNEFYNGFIGFEFEFMLDDSFFDGLKVFLKNIGDNNVFFYTLDPSPEDYFYKYFMTYSILDISLDVTNEELNTILMRDPGDSPADALAINSNEISWFSQSKEWAILGSREWEIAIVGFGNPEVKQKFIQSFNEDAQTMFTSIETQVNALDEMLNFDQETKSKYKKLIQCYQDKTSF